MKRLIPVLILFFFLSCAEKPPGGILSKDIMINLLTDIHLVDGYSMSMVPDSGASKVPVLYRSVFNKYQTDSVQFRKSITYYSHQPVMLDSIYKAVNRKLEQMEKAESDRLAKEAEKREKFYRDSLKQDSIKKDSIERLKEQKQQELQDAFKRKKIMQDSVKQVGAKKKS